MYGGVIKDKKVSKSIIGIIEDYIKDMSNHVFIKSDMRKKNLQDNNSYEVTMVLPPVYFISYNT